MKQNGAVAAYQIIQIHPPTSHPDLIQLSRAKSSGTILWKRNTKEGKEEVKQTEKENKKNENKVSLASSQPVRMKD